LIGHCRRDLEGNWRDNRNNHPFLGQTGDGTRYALAHNGILSGLRALRARFGLEPSAIKTDSYGAVSLINASERLSLDSLGTACESLRGSYLFTILDCRGNIYICRGDVPVSLVHFRREGLFLYASTRDLLEAGLRGTALGRAYQAHNLELAASPVCLIRVGKGEIVRLSPSGQLSKGWFRFNEDQAIRHNWYRHDVEMTDELKEQIKNLDN
jgi:asparagine synthetase B (glutamine-hydrolysing)